MKSFDIFFLLKNFFLSVFPKIMGGWGQVCIGSLRPSTVPGTWYYTLSSYTERLRGLFLVIPPIYFYCSLVCCSQSALHFSWKDTMRHQELGKKSLRTLTTKWMVVPRWSLKYFPQSANVIFVLPFEKSIWMVKFRSEATDFDECQLHLLRESYWF